VRIKDSPKSNAEGSNKKESKKKNNKQKTENNTTVTPKKNEKTAVPSKGEKEGRKRSPAKDEAVQQVPSLAKDIDKIINLLSLK
jgi:hypothetical protein